MVPISTLGHLAARGITYQPIRATTVPFSPLIGLCHCPEIVARSTFIFFVSGEQIC